MGITLFACSPSTSIARCPSPDVARARQRLARHGIDVRLAAGCDQPAKGGSSSLADRNAQLTDALSSDADGIIAVTGGWNSIELLRSLDFEAFSRLPSRVVCGMSDITTLTTACHVALGWTTVYGPNLVMLGSGPWTDQQVADLARMIAGNPAPQSLMDPPSIWTKDTFGTDGDHLPIAGAAPMSAVRPGSAVGAVFGGHLGTLNLLAGTRFWPRFVAPVVLFVEDDALLGRGTMPEALRRLEALLLDEDLLRQLAALVVGRFEPEAELVRGGLARALLDIEPLRDVPIVIDAPFGHTRPVAALPIGGRCELHATTSGVDLVVRCAKPG